MIEYLVPHNGATRSHPLLAAIRQVQQRHPSRPQKQSSELLDERASPSKCVDIT